MSDTGSTQKYNAIITDGAGKELNSIEDVPLRMALKFIENHENSQSPSERTAWSYHVEVVEVDG